MAMRFLACDSTGKTSSKGRAYCYATCQATNTSACAYKPGAALDEIMRGAVAEVPLSQYRAGTIVSMANGLSIPFSTWQAGTREHYRIEFDIFAAKMQAHRIDTTLVFGGDPTLWPYDNHLNEDYRLIQRDILRIATGHGIRCFTGMEAQFHGGLGRFANPTPYDHALLWHRSGVDPGSIENRSKIEPGSILDPSRIDLGETLICATVLISINPVGGEVGWRA